LATLREVLMTSFKEQIISLSIRIIYC
jgi:hypothetical protein